MPRTGTEIIVSLNATLAYLLAKKARDVSFAIVDSSGNGHFSSLSDAVTSGAKHIFIKNGTYIETEEITLTDQVIIGETRGGTILQLNDVTIAYDRSGDEVVGNGTTQKIKFTNDSVLVTQAGAADCGFTAVTKDETTRLYTETLIAKVDEITDTNNLNMTAKFFGRTLDILGADLALDYIVENIQSNNSIIANLTINHFLTVSDNAIEVYGYNHAFIDISFISIQNSSKFLVLGGIGQNPALNTLIHNCSFEGGDTSIELNSAKMTTISECYFAAADTLFIDGDDDTEYLHIENNVLTSSIDGINFTGNYITISMNEFLMIAERAIFINKNGVSVKASILDNNFKYCGKNATTETCIYIDCHGPIVSGNSFFDCQSPIKFTLVENGIISGNVFDNCKQPVTTSGGSKNTISENQFFDLPSGETAISNNANRNTFSNNQFEDCTPINNIFDGAFSGNVIVYSSDTTLTFSDSGSLINANMFIKANIVISGDKVGFRANKILDTVAGWGLTVTGDKNLISGNRFENLANGIDIQATADKTHLLQCIFDNITTTAIQNNGTNTVQANNIT